MKVCTAIGLLESSGRKMAVLELNLKLLLLDVGGCDNNNDTRLQ